MYELLLIAQTKLVELLLDEVFDSLYIMIRHPLNLLDACSILGREAQVNIVESVGAVFAEYTTEVRKLFAEGDEVEYLYTDAVADECFFGEVSS